MIYSMENDEAFFQLSHPLFKFEGISSNNQYVSHR